MPEFDENRLTDLMEFVGRKLVGDEDWEKASMDQRRIMKQNVLDITLAVDEFREGEEFKPKRGDAVEAYLKRTRDELTSEEPTDILDEAGAEYEADVIDELLDDYRLHADTGTPLSMNVQMPTPLGGDS